MQQCGRVTQHPVKTLTIKKHEQPRQASGAAGETEEADDDSDYDVPGSKIKKWFGKLTARVKASWFFKSDL